MNYDRPHQTSNAERLQKVLANRGVASRRKAEELIVEGRVSVDGEVVRELGTKVDPDRADITVDGKRVRSQTLRYIMLNKPAGYITTMADERGRRTVRDLVDVPEAVKPVGRLDRQTEGLLLFTNDGEVAHRVMHPRFEVEKEYVALLDGVPPPEALERMRRGLTIDGERTVPTMVRPVKQTEDGTVVRITIHEGRNRIVRRLFDAIGYPAITLSRTRIGPLQIGNIPRGSWRDLTPGELSQLFEAVELDSSGAETMPPSSRHPKRQFSPSSRDRRRR